MVNIQNTDDNGCFKWFLVRYLNPADHNPSRIRKVDKDFAKRLDFKDIKLPVEIRDFHKFEINNSISICVFDYENNVFLSMILRDSYMTIYYILEKNIFVLLVHTLVLQKKN